MKHSTNINKTNNSDFTSLNTNKQTTTKANRNPGRGLGQPQQCGRVKPITVISTLQCLNTLIANNNKNGKENPRSILFYSYRSHTITKLQITACLG